jgi:signal transduction histidine kinase
MELEGLQRVVRDEHMQLRNYMKHLKTPSFGENEFADALRTHVRNFERDSGVKVQLTLPARGLKLSRSANREIYQIIQEALANVRKHSAASQVTIRIEQDDKMMQLHVIDNGRGFSGESGGHTESLQKKPWSIAERTRALSGHLTVESRPGQGTTLTVLIPIVPPNQAFRARLR